MRALPKVKVCGLTSLEDTLVAHEAGADAFGFVAVKQSQRVVSADQVAAISAQLPPDCMRVGIFVGDSPGAVAAFADLAGLNAVQLCGSEQPADFADFPYPILRRLPADEDGMRQLEVWRQTAWGFVIDHPASAGGSGEQVDEKCARELAAAAPCLLAGGLAADNVAAAALAVEPCGVDASSRLESAPGRKDHTQVRAFVINALEALK